jgi:hypothetical protein
MAKVGGCLATVKVEMMGVENEGGGEVFANAKA